MTPDSGWLTRRKWTRIALLKEVTRVLQASEVVDAQQHAEWMLEAATREERATLYANARTGVSNKQLEQIENWVKRRCAGEPIQYILETAYFRNLTLRVTPAVLIPRPETEEVVEEGLRLIQSIEKPAVLDVGTGSGCIALSIKQERPDARVAAVDNSSDALSVAEENASACDLSIRFVQADMVVDDLSAYMSDRFHLLISNPPYVLERERGELPEEVLHHEPQEAIFAGKDPLQYYRALVRQSRNLLNPGGWLVLEIHEEMGASIAQLMQKAGLEGVAILPDLAGKDRIGRGRFGT